MSLQGAAVNICKSHDSVSVTMMPASLKFLQYVSFSKHTHTKKIPHTHTLTLLSDPGGSVVGRMWTMLVKIAQA